MQKFLYQQCLMSKIPFPNWGKIFYSYLSPTNIKILKKKAKKWIDIRKLFSNWFGLRRCNINKMLDYIGLKFEGNPHCGIISENQSIKFLTNFRKKNFLFK